MALTFKVIIIQVSVQIGLNLTGLELSLAISNKIMETSYLDQVTFKYVCIIFYFVMIWK